MSKSPIPLNVGHCSWLLEEHADGTFHWWLGDQNLTRLAKGSASNYRNAERSLIAAILHHVAKSRV